MHLNLTYLAARSRETGRVEFLAEVAHLCGGGECAVVAHMHELLRGPTPDGIAMREKYSHALFVVDNIVRAQYEFPCPVAMRKVELQRSVLAAKAAAEIAEAKLAELKSATAAIKPAVSSVTEANRQVATLEAALAELEKPEPEKEPEKTL